MNLEPEPRNITSHLIIIAILILVNAFFTAAEMAIVSLSKNKIKILVMEGNEKAELLSKLKEKPNKFLTTMQTITTLAGFFSSALAATDITGVFSTYLSKFNIPSYKEIALIIVTLILSYITLVFGKLFPRRLALRKSESIAMLTIKPVLFLSKIFFPFVKLLSLSTNILLKLFHIEREGLDDNVSREEIRSMLEVGEKYGEINEIEREMIDGIFEFDDKLAYEVMTPRADAYLINIETPLIEYLDVLIEKGFSRIPVYEENIDNIIGILYIKDLFVEVIKKDIENIDIKSILQPAYFIPERKNIDDLFKELQSRKTHIAVLIDEYGGFSGIVSIEDLIEEIMGEIEDEYDKNEPKINKIDEDTFIIDGGLSLDDFNDYFNTDIESNVYDTIAGFLIDLLGYIPNGSKNESVKYEDITFEIEEIKEKRIEKVKILKSN